ncbi:hypothetical protein [Hansschlegelia beijingensis]|uniref:Uncharacterized protein n=1 Tax=Hansschlegelia beijingensis TaxID=1133344 RepID=A0A7W6D401_9HYPH|nr:hypothetical protein [Hansschlegelia beijingensis]MBB3973692.1 hypothetical protein [Hansschlegelia beijingensis]
MDKLTELGAQAIANDARDALNASFHTAVTLLFAGGAAVLLLLAATRLL